MKYADEAKTFVEAVREIAGKPENLDNLECYLAHNFDKWLEKWASTPGEFAAEMRSFASMEI